LDSSAKSREGRNLTIMTIQSPNRRLKNAVWVDGGLHAREWISPAATLYFVEKLVKDEFVGNSGNSPYTKVAWIILPMANPDGYENSRSGPKKRYWRKNMSVNQDSSCRGTDLNRNLGIPAEAYGVGASTDPCSDVFQGERSISEPEIMTIVKAIDDNKHILKSSIAVHSYGQKFLTSWGYKFDLPDDHDELTAWGKDAAAAIKTIRGTKYGVGTASGGLYVAGGATDDYAKSKGVKFVATIELGDTGKHGFVLPAEEIVDTGKELHAAMRVVAEAAANPDKYS